MFNSGAGVGIRRRQTGEVGRYSYCGSLRSLFMFKRGGCQQRLVLLIKS